MYALHYPIVKFTATLFARSAPINNGGRNVSIFIKKNGQSEIRAVIRFLHPKGNSPTKKKT